MTDSVVERLARAMMTVRFASGDYAGQPVLSMDPDYDDLPERAADFDSSEQGEPSREEIHALARAALDAIEEPTPEMKIAGQEAAFFEPLDNMVAGIDEPEAAVWRAMIRRAQED